MRDIKFDLKEKSKANKIYLVVEFAGGDADTEHPHHYLLPFPFNEWESNVELIKKEYDEFKILESLLDNHRITYEEIEENWGKDMARLYDNVPNDPQTDYDTKCYIDGIHLIGYDENCNEYKAYL